MLHGCDCGIVSVVTNNMKITAVTVSTGHNCSPAQGIVGKPIALLSKGNVHCYRPCCMGGMKVTKAQINTPCVYLLYWLNGEHCLPLELIIYGLSYLWKIGNVYIAQISTCGGLRLAGHCLQDQCCCPV